MSACNANPCRNSGKCIPDSSGSGFFCECGEGSNGTLCQVSQKIQKVAEMLWNNTSYYIGKKVDINWPLGKSKNSILIIFFLPKSRSLKSD